MPWPSSRKSICPTSRYLLTRQPGVLLRHLRDYYEKSYLYGQPVVVSEDAMSGDISIDTAQVHIDIELDPQSANSLQQTEKSSKIKPSDQQNS